MARLGLCGHRCVIACPCSFGVGQPLGKSFEGWSSSRVPVARPEGCPFLPAGQVADPLPEPLLSAETGRLTDPPPFTEISDPPEWLPAAADPPVALPLPEPLLSADTGAFTALGSVAEISDPPAWLPLPDTGLPPEPEPPPAPCYRRWRFRSRSCCSAPRSAG